MAAKCTLVSVFAAAIILLPSVSASTLSPGQTLEVTFSTGYSSTNLLVLSMAPGLSATGSPVMTTQLYDETAGLIGSVSNTLQESPDGAFYVAEFPLDLPPPYWAKLSGRFVITVEGGTVGNINPGGASEPGSIAVRYAILEHGYAWNSGMSLAPDPGPDPSPEPEPVSFLSGFSGLLLFGVRAARPRLRGR